MNLQAAVPKSQKLQLNAVSKGDLEGGEEATQAMRVSAVQGVSLDEFNHFLLFHLRVLLITYTGLAAETEVTVEG